MRFILFMKENANCKELLKIKLRIKGLEYQLKRNNDCLNPKELYFQWENKLINYYSKVAIIELKQMLK